MKLINFIQNINGIIIYNDFDTDNNIPFKEQEYSFKNDILQIKFGDKFILDVGWYPEFDPSGHFVIRVILDYDWHNPLLKTKCNTLDELKYTIEQAALLIEEKRKANN